MKRWTKILLALVGLVVVTIVSISLFVNAHSFRPAIERQLTTTLGRSVTVGDLRLSLFAASLVAKDLSVADDPSCSAAPFLTAKEFRIGVSLRTLTARGQLPGVTLTADSGTQFTSSRFIETLNRLSIRHRRTAYHHPQGLWSSAYGYIALAGLWAAPVTGASMNQVRSLAPDLVRGDFQKTWIHVVGPAVGALIGGVGFEWILKGKPTAAGGTAAEGTLGVDDPAGPDA